MQNYNIYINEKALIITSVLKEGVKTSQIIDVQSFDFLKFYQQLPKNEGEKFFLISENPETAFEQLKKQVLVLEAAGGLVKNSEGKYLFIKRLGKWDLPKGKAEKGESIEETAVREVEEECGITVDGLKNKIVDTYHVYDSKGQLILKKTYWFAMECFSAQNLIPQLEEDITEARWIGEEGFDIVYENTYPSILDVLRNFKSTNN